jgi:hypothetical protein
MRSIVEVKRVLIEDGRLDSDAKVLTIFAMMEGGSCTFTGAAKALGWDYGTVESAARVLRRECMADTERDGLTLTGDERTEFTARRFRVAARVEQTREKTEAAAEKARGRREAAAARRASSPAPEKQKRGEPTATDVEAWFREAIIGRFGDVSVGRWAIRDKAHARDMLRDYGPELTERAVRFFAATYDGDGLPGIRLLYALRDKVFGQLQRGGAGDRKHADEYDHGGADKAPESGW